jgi:ubiquinone/menaquinone biosynthesis C-methylase UbiE
MRATWEASFAEQVASQAYNTAPVEALVRSVSYYLRDVRPDGEYSGLHFAEMGCGAGPNLVWLAEKGITVSGVDISPTALGLARRNLAEHDLEALVGELIEGSVTSVPALADESLDGVIESCVFQHLNREDRVAAFGEAGRVLKPGGLFVGHMLEQQHTVYAEHADEELAEDPGTLQLEEGGSRFYLTNIGLSHFFSAAEVRELLDGWSSVDPCLLQYELPAAEARKRGYADYRQSMLVVHAIK